jgi:hypothetical protein
VQCCRPGAVQQDTVFLLSAGLFRQVFYPAGDNGKVLACFSSAAGFDDGLNASRFVWGAIESFSITVPNLCPSGCSAQT